MVNNIMNNNLIFYNIANTFTNVASEMFKYYDKQEKAAGIASIMQNITWSGMWDFLVDYFLKQHNIDIDINIQKDPISFDSTMFKRYEYNMLTEIIYDVRKIEINFLNNKQEIIINIEPSLTTKKAKLIEQFDNIYIYEGEDPDFMFEITLNQRFNIPEKIILHRRDKNLKLIYY
jgi:hypothetical protein